MSILVVGTAAYDALKSPFGEVERALGGSAVYFALAACNFSHVSICAVVGKDFEAADLELLEHKGVDISGVERSNGETFFWKGEYHEDLNTAHTKETRLGVLADFDPQISDEHVDAEVVFLANVDPVVQLKVLNQMTNPKIVAMDTMNFWIDGKPNELREVLSQVDMLLINDGEAAMLSGSRNILRTGRMIREMGPKTVCIKRGEYGVIVFHEAGMFATPAYPLETIKDPTGAGDSFAGGFLGYLASQHGDLSMHNIRNAAVYGSTVASFTCEEFSVARLARLDREMVDERFELFRELTQF